MKNTTNKTGKRTTKRDPSPYPKGWDQKRVQALIQHYENQSDDEGIAEAEAAYEDAESAMMQVPIQLVPQVQKLLAKRAG